MLNAVAAQAKKPFAMEGFISMPPVNADRIESWFGILRTGSTRERLAVVREMVDKILPSEANAVVKLYPEEGDRVRWGLIRVLGELKMEFATPIILNDLRNSFHTECAMEALGKIGSEGRVYCDSRLYCRASRKRTHRVAAAGEDRKRQGDTNAYGLI